MPHLPTQDSPHFHAWHAWLLVGPALVGIGG